MIVSGCTFFGSEFYIFIVLPVISIGVLANSIQLSPEGEVNSGGKCFEDAILSPVAKQLISKDVRYIDGNT